MSVRTWFGTLTLNPAERTRVLWTARRWCRIFRLEDFDALEPAERFALQLRVTNREVTLFLKRLRKGNPQFRYLLVAEEHKEQTSAGVPHYHMLLHETGEPITKRTLEAQWQAGFSHWRLVERGDVQAAFYVAKYLGKDTRGRVRNSLKYGQPRAGTYLSAEVMSTMDANAR